VERPDALPEVLARLHVRGILPVAAAHLAPADAERVLAVLDEQLVTVDGGPVPDLTPVLIWGIIGVINNELEHKLNKYLFIINSNENIVKKNHLT
jgi:hypothetical protein